MLYVEKNGVSVPKLGYGTWQLEGQVAVDGVKFALSTGYRHVDTAQAYGNEAEVGKAIAESGVPRGEIFLTTKIWRDNVGAEALAPSLEESLRRLGTEYVDLLLIHWPVEEVPLAETMEALQKVQQEGKTRLIGVSNFTVAQMTEVVETLGIDIATNQVEYHPHLSQKPVLEFLRKHGQFLTAYSPLGRGRLFDEPVLQEIAAKHKRGVGQVVLRWHVQQPEVVAIPKSATASNTASNHAIFDFSLSEEEMRAITALTAQNKRFVNPGFAPVWDAAE